MAACADGFDTPGIAVLSSSGLTSTSSNVSPERKPRLRYQFLLKKKTVVRNLFTSEYWLSLISKELK
jgi:hypothetical protein